VTVKAIDPNGLVRDIRSDSSGNLSTTLGTRLAGGGFGCGHHPHGPDRAGHPGRQHHLRAGHQILAGTLVRLVVIQAAKRADGSAEWLWMRFRQ